MSIITAIDTAFMNMKKRDWDKIYYFFDIHETVLYPNYGRDEPLTFYPDSKIVLQYLTTREDISMGMFTCSYPREIISYMEFFRTHKIEFEFANKNPDVENTQYGYYEDKPYFNVLFEDKAGFNAEKDWTIVREYFNL